MRPDSVRRRWRVSWKTAVAGVVALLALGFLLVSPLIGTTIFSALRAHHTNVVNAEANHFGDLVHDAGFDFVVHSADCGVPALTGPDGQHLKPTNGSFCVVSVTVHNDGPEPEGLPGIVQLATGSRGAVYLPDVAADTTVNGGDPTLSPGESWDARLVYDVPVGIQLVQVSLHSAEYSRGVKVRL
jgi:hypothetical protein